MNTFGKLAIGAVFVGAVAYGIAFAIRQAELAKQTSVNLDSLKDIKFSMSTGNMSVTANLSLNNATNVNVVLNGGKIKASIDNKNLAEIIITDKKKVPAKSSVIIPIAIQFNLLDTLRNAHSVVNQLQSQGLGLSSININLKGSLSLSSGILLFSSVPVDLVLTGKDLGLPG